MSQFSRICPLCEKGMEEEQCPEHHVPTIELSLVEEKQDALGPGDEIAGRYQVKQILGKGAMGSVYLAIQLSMDREVAIKTLLKRLLSDYKLVQRFYREARAVSKLDHPNIIRTYDFGIDPDSKMPFIVMEYLEGEDLADMIRGHGRMSEQAACGLLAQIAKALVEAHEKGIIHRDLKPQNIRVRTLADGELQAKVLDFGIAKALQADQEEGDNLTGTGITVGTPAYMSPEQIVGDRVDARADLYSLGCILYELLAGTPPFETGDRRENFLQHMNAKPPELPALLADGQPPSEGLQVLHKSLLSKSRDSRPPDAKSVAKVLSALAVGRTVGTSDTLTGALADLKAKQLSDAGMKAITGEALAALSQEATDAAIPTDPDLIAMARETMARNKAAEEQEKEVQSASEKAAVETGPAIETEVLSSGAGPSQGSATSQSSSSKWLIPSFVIGVAAIAVAIIVTGGETQAPQAPPARPQAAQPKAASVPQTKPSSAAKAKRAEKPVLKETQPKVTVPSKVRLVSKPSGATVYAGKILLGKTPLEVAFADDVTSRELHLTLEGHVSSALVLSKTGPNPRTVQLDAMKAAAPAKPTPKPKVSVSSKKKRPVAKKRRKPVLKKKPKKKGGKKVKLPTW